MNCKLVQEYISSIISGQTISSLKDDNFCLELYTHYTNCGSCRNKFGLTEGLLHEIENHYNFIRPSKNLKNKIFSEIKRQRVLNIPSFKKSAIAACFAAIIGVGIISEATLPSAYDIHDFPKYSLDSTELDRVISHIDEQLVKYHFMNFEQAGFIPIGASKVNKLFNRKISSIAFKHANGHKLTLCFYPKGYKLPHNDYQVIDKTKVFHGKRNNHNFAYWEKNNRTTVLISKSLSPDEMIELASPLITNNL